MKKPGLYIGLSVFALMVIISIEIYSLGRIYQLEKDRVQNQYKDLIRTGLDAVEENDPDLGLKTAYQALDFFSREYLQFYQSGAVTDTLAFRQIVLQKMHQDFNRFQTLGSLVDKLLEKNQMNTRYTPHFVFRDIRLETWNDSLAIYDQERDRSWVYDDTLGISDESLFMGSYRKVSNHFSCRYDFYVDFREMEKMVLTRLTGLLFIMTLSLVLVGLIFLITLRNMLEERRLSLLKTDFINNMTHELKTPLSTISIATRTLGADSVLRDPEKARDTVRIIDRQNRNLSRQINHLIDVSMWERKQFELDKKWVNLPHLLRDILDGFRLGCKDVQLTLIQECRISDDLEVFLDELLITNALHNLLKNAVKYTEADPEIRFSCDIERDWILIRVKDNGIGMSAESLKHVFDKFYRVPTGNLHKIKGLGLGLFYVRQIVEAHGGTVGVTSKLNSGSTFTIKLPYHGRAKNLTRRG